MLHSDTSELQDKTQNIYLHLTFSFLKILIPVEVVPFKMPRFFLHTMKYPEIGSNFFINFEDETQLRTSMAIICVSFTTTFSSGKLDKFSYMSSTFSCTFR